MTRTGRELGRLIDRTSTVQTDLNGVREAVLTREGVAKEEGDTDLARELAWERAVIDLNVPPRPDYSLFHGADFERYAEFYGLSDETVDYSRLRAEETGNALLRVHHLEYVLARGPQRGREWFISQRKLAQAYRVLVDEVLGQLPSGADATIGLHISDWIERLASLISVPGILRPEELKEMAHWITEVAKRLKEVQWKVENGISMEHRWPFEILRNLVVIPEDCIADDDKATALDLLQQAYDHYSRDPLAEQFTSAVAEVDAAVRKHFGEGDTHERMVRRKFEALRRAAEFHRKHGSGLVAQSFFREARTLAEQQRQYFEAAELEKLQRLEREALQAAVEGGEFKEIRSAEVTVNLDEFDRRQSTGAETIGLIMALRHHRIPSQADLRTQAAKIIKEYPVQHLFSTVIIDDERVVGEARTEEHHFDRAIQLLTDLHAQVVGLEIEVTLTRAAREGQITADDVVRELELLHLDEEERDVLRRGIERYLAEDYISAGHILSAQFENLFRKKLAEAGVEPTRFRVQQDGTTRTDVASLGELMYSSTPDGRTVRELIGEDAWEFINRTMVAVSGCNLRNKFAHGFARRHECSGTLVGVILHHILWLATLEVEPVEDNTESRNADGLSDSGPDDGDTAPEVPPGT